MWLKIYVNSLISFYVIGCSKMDINRFVAQLCPIIISLYWAFYVLCPIIISLYWALCIIITIFQINICRHIVLNLEHPTSKPKPKPTRPFTCSETSQARGVIILGDVEEITCSNTILNLEYLTLKPIWNGWKDPKILYLEIQSFKYPIWDLDPHLSTYSIPDMVTLKSWWFKP